MGNKGCYVIKKIFMINHRGTLSPLFESTIHLISGLQESMNNVSCRRDMTEILLKAA